MNKQISPIFWLIIAFILLIPTSVGKFLLDIAGWSLFIIFSIPIFIAGASWIGIKLIQAKLKNCENCGATFFNNQSSCPICGMNIDNNKNNSENYGPASTATIDITPEEVD